MTAVCSGSCRNKPWGASLSGTAVNSKRVRRQRRGQRFAVGPAAATIAAPPGTPAPAPWCGLHSVPAPAPAPAAAPAPLAPAPAVVAASGLGTTALALASPPGTSREAYMAQQGLGGHPVPAPTPTPNLTPDTTPSSRRSRKIRPRPCSRRRAGRTRSSTPGPRRTRRRRGVPWRRKCPPPWNFLHRRRRACLLSRGFFLLMPAARPKPDRRPDGLPPRAGVTGLSPLTSTAPSFLNDSFF